MDPVHKVIKKVEATISRFRMIHRGDRVVAAVSGGADSVCLLDVLHRLTESLGFSLIVAHFDHGLRPGADEHETDFVRGLTVSRHLEAMVSKAAPPLDPTAASLEEKAREARYRFLKECMHASGAQEIATGHTLNDQAETVLMRLLRGSGPAGLSGIQPMRKDGVIRPLIRVSREEIEGYLGTLGLSHITDTSNVETRHLRNDIRLNLIPRLQGYQPRIVEVLSRTADIIREENEWIEAQAREWLSRHAVTGEEGCVFPMSRFGELPEALKAHVVRAGLKTVAGTLRKIRLDHIREVERLMGSGKPQGRVKLPGNLWVRRVYDRVVFSKDIPPPPETYCCFIERAGSFYVDGVGLTLTLEEVKPEGPPGRTGDPWTAFIDADRVAFPLMLKNFRPGDRFIPFGMKGHKKLKDLFVDMKLPSHVRSRIPILAQKDQLIWVCGLRLDDRFKVTPDTRRVFKVTLEGMRPVGTVDKGGLEV